MSLRVLEVFEAGGDLSEPAASCLSAAREHLPGALAAAGAEVDAVTLRPAERASAPGGFDIVHFHGARPWPGATLNTVYGAKRDTSPVVALSWSHAASLGLPVSGVIYPSVEELRPLDAVTPEDYLVFAGPATAARGFDTAVRFAKSAEMPMILLAPVGDEPEMRALARSEQQAGRLRIVYARGEDWDAVVCRARAMLVTPREPAPFEYPALRAQALGVPVIGMEGGSLPEIVQRGETGLLVADARALPVAFDQLHLIDRAACARRASALFDPAGAAFAYLWLFERLADGDKPLLEAHPEQLAGAAR